MTKRLMLSIHRDDIETKTCFVWGKIKIVICSAHSIHKAGEFSTFPTFMETEDSIAGYMAFFVAKASCKGLMALLHFLHQPLVLLVL